MNALARVASSTSIPVATGERLTTKMEFFAALQAGVSILQPDIGRSGGLWETKKIASIAEVFNAQIAPHIYCGPVAHAAAAQLAFTCPNFLILETILTDFHNDILTQALTWESGYMLLPETPGLGVELNESVLNAHPYETGGRLHLEMCQTPLDSANKRTITEIE